MSSERNRVAQMERSRKYRLRLPFACWIDIYCWVLLEIRFLSECWVVLDPAMRGRYSFGRSWFTYFFYSN